MIKNFTKKFGEPNDVLFIMGDYDKGSNNMSGLEPTICKKFRKIFKNAGFKKIIENNAWHFSYFGGISKIKEKLKNFSHCEYKHISNLSDEEINRRISNFEDLLGRNEFFYAIENNLTPELLSIMNK